MRNRDAQSSRLEAFLADPRKSLWVLALPMMLGMTVQTAYMLADMIFVGRVSADALTALAFNMPVVFFAIGITFGLGTGITAVIAQYIGADDKLNADSSAEHAVALGAVLAIVLTICGLLWGREFLGLLGVPPELMEPAWQYLRILAGGFPFMVMAVFFRSILSGEGDMKTPTLIQVAATLLNIVLDPIFIFVLEMGVEGAAAATVVAQALAAGVYVYLLFFKRHTYVTFELSHFRPSARILGRIFQIGVPTSFAFLVMSFGGGVFNRILISFSSEAVAAFQVGNRLDHIFLLPTMAIAAALVTLVGMFYGAGRPELMRRIIAYAMTRALLIAAVVGTLFFVFAPQLIAAFSEDPAIRTAGTDYLRIIVFSYPFVAVSMLSGRSLQGMGYGAPVLVLTSLRVLLISAPLAYLVVHRMHKPLVWVWGAIVVGIVCAAATGFLWLRWGLRRADLSPGLGTAGLDTALP